ncbi:hypothetical protein P691DRAFT_808368 [Macrolepiota fuliginosa MF-IS2]|uniref:NYN domain-containing protein n=1 Tax=Macrolepiota fuliginosa MF-IS2 TaxID=1400762 RepID=A0A9P6C3X9_9AGAR|nr:hypothetical protein P691DRAFT_808368 [Macrolepiota fuliginosa MF-IS2]
MVQSKIKVFWDLETCPPPTAHLISPWDLLENIRTFTSGLGVVTSIKAYWDGNKEKDPGSNATSLRTAIPSMGISFIDCSLVQEYSEDALARTLTVDFLVSAIDDPMSADGSEKNIIMIFSGNKTILS